MATTKQRGFSLLELVIVITFSLIMGGITYMAMKGYLVQGHTNVAYERTFMALRNARNLAITQQHEYYVVFYGSPGALFPSTFPTGTILIMYQPPAVSGVLPALQQVITYTIPSDTSFAVSSAVGFPTGATNTPDGFGTGVAPIDFGQGLGAGSLSFVVFMPDGSSQDNLGNYNSGVIYITNTGATGMGQLLATRAITVWGATGRVRGWTLRQTGATTSEWAEQ
jgi:prepilin-type N-terminal cleavage/methylation domain-containing protein